MSEEKRKDGFYVAMIKGNEKPLLVFFEETKNRFFIMDRGFDRSISYKEESFTKISKKEVISFIKKDVIGFSDNTEEGIKDLDKTFKYHRPTEKTIPLFEECRGHAANFFHFLKRSVPESYERTEAEKKIQEAMFWANASIARNINPPPEEELFICPENNNCDEVENCVHAKAHKKTDLCDKGCLVSIPSS
jgi:hypothetical protein